MKSKTVRGTMGPLLLVVFGLSLVGLMLQPAGAGDDAGKALVAKAVDAIGGVEAATGWETRVGKGRLTSNWPGWGELHADCLDLVQKPDKMKLDQDYSAYDHPFFFTYYYNGGEAWMMVNLGTRQNERTTSRMAERMKTIDGLAYYLTNCDTFYLVTDVPDDSLVTAASIDRVGVVDDGDTVLFDLDKTTHMLVRRIEASGSRQTLFDDYKETGGIKMPYHVTSFENGSRSEYVWDEIKFNEKIDPAQFEEYRPKQKEES
jgi:hypothetical protein